ncbi:hypothetical protein H5P28_15010 [Ruficoccus amylovorans]|uniref:Right-handed parallel beta-helix repeat-containing protein n=1 Tax=Ruficoccus amylovorans TaxID=1804625 RepID=A0A842HFX8_9BACT|nr:hypothetical protein [Ruficoccus amylovorans]MBC2595575.1 hypothetical protein [Ruficoccus amylovorans]
MISPPTLSPQTENHLKALEIKHYTRPGDPDSAEGIRQALDDARQQGIRHLLFESGCYRLRSSIVHPTQGMVHDAGSSPDIAEKQCHILIDGIEGLTLQGAVTDDGQPATILAGWNDGQEHGLLPAVLWCEAAPRLTLKNLGFTREPAFTSAGEIIKTDATGFTVRVFEDCPEWAGMGVYCANRFSSDGQTLLGESITYGNGTDAKWESQGKGLLTLASPAIAAKLTAGELLSWHQGARTDFQVYIAGCDNLHLENLRTFNNNGFSLLTENCHTITARRVVFRPDGNRLFTGPRDAWKIFKCGGIIDIDGMSIHGVRMDGQNMHANWLSLKEKISPTELILHCRYTYAPILPGSLIEFYDGIIEHTCTVASVAMPVEQDKGRLYRVVLREPAPDFLNTETMCAARCWEPDRYLCRNSEFINIAGAGHLARFGNLSLLNNIYRNTMNPGVLLGAELPTHCEGGHATNVLIDSCLFDNCGFFPRYKDAAGCVGIYSYGFDAPYNHDISITNNTFRNARTAIKIRTARDVRIWNNHYENIGERLIVDKNSSRDILSLD